MAAREATPSNEVREVQHTPGPLFLSQGEGRRHADEIWVRTEEGSGSVVCAVWPMGEDEAEQIANARLHATAWKLYNAAVRAEEALAIAASYRDTDQARINLALDETRAALALVRGQAVSRDIEPPERITDPVMVGVDDVDPWTGEAVS